MVDGVAHEVAVYTTAVLTLFLGRSTPTLRLWLTTGVLPEPYHRKNLPGMKLTKGSHPRLITKDELRVIYDCRDKLAVQSQGKVYSVFTQCVAEGFAKLSKGIRISA